MTQSQSPPLFATTGPWCCFVTADGHTEANLVTGWKELARLKQLQLLVRVADTLLKEIIQHQNKQLSAGWWRCKVSKVLPSQQLCNNHDSFPSASFTAFYLTPVILQLPVGVSGVQREERLSWNSKRLRTDMLLIELAGIFMTGWCVSVKGMSLWAAKSTHSGRKNVWGQINKYSNAFYLLGIPPQEALRFP